MIFLEVIFPFGNLLAVGSDCDDEDGYIDTGSAYLFYIENNGTVNFLGKSRHQTKHPVTGLVPKFPYPAIFLPSLPTRRAFPVPVRPISTGWNQTVH